MAAKAFSKKHFVSFGLRSGAKGGLALREAFVKTDVVLLDKFAARLGIQVAIKSLLGCQCRGSNIDTRFVSNVIRVLARKLAHLKH